MLASHLLDRLIRVGSLAVTDADGRVHLFQGADGPEVAVRLHDRALHHRLLTSPSLAFGEAYMDGTITVETGDVYDLLALIGVNLELAGRSGLAGVEGPLGRLFRGFQQFNPVPWARARVAHHYDLSEALYDLFLDADKQYSCAYFLDPWIGLDEAQEAKKRHLAAKLLIRPGQRSPSLGMYLHLVELISRHRHMFSLGYYPNLPCDGLSGKLVVSSNHDNLNPSLSRLVHGCLCIRPGRVA